MKPTDSLLLHTLTPDADQTELTDAFEEALFSVKKQILQQAPLPQLLNKQVALATQYYTLYLKLGGELIQEEAIHLSFTALNSNLAKATAEYEKAQAQLKLMLSKCNALNELTSLISELLRLEYNFTQIFCSTYSSFLSEPTNYQYNTAVKLSTVLDLTQVHIALKQLGSTVEEDQQAASYFLHTEAFRRHKMLRLFQ